MDEVLQYEQYLRERITELRGQKNVSEHRLSLELGKSGSYIRSITSGATSLGVFCRLGSKGPEKGGVREKAARIR